MVMLNKPAGDIACPGSSVVDLQLRLLRVPGSFPGWGGGGALGGVRDFYRFC